MNARTLPPGVDCATGARPGWRARLELAFERRGERSTLAHVRHTGPLTLQRPLYPEGEGVCHAIVVHPPGGVAGGDALEIAVSAGAGAHAVLTTPGAGKFYKSAGRVAAQSVIVGAAAGAVVEWLPQETIIFDGADARLELDIDLAHGARALAWEIVALGRTASGETFTHGRLRQRLRIRCGGALRVDEAGDTRGGSAWLQAAPGWRGQVVSATLVAVGAVVDDALLDRARTALEGHPGAAVTRVTPDVLIGRYLGPATEPARAALFALWSVLRPAVAGIAAQTPRIWST
jgi:urease accessory protein